MHSLQSRQLKSQTVFVSGTHSRPENMFVRDTRSGHSTMFLSGACSRPKTIFVTGTHKIRNSVWRLYNDRGPTMCFAGPRVSFIQACWPNRCRSQAVMLVSNTFLKEESEDVAFLVGSTRLVYVVYRIYWWEETRSKACFTGLRRLSSVVCWILLLERAHLHTRRAQKMVCYDGLWRLTCVRCRASVSWRDSQQLWITILM